jgi:hypothetical protein
MLSLEHFLEQERYDRQLEDTSNCRCQESTAHAKVHVNRHDGVNENEGETKADIEPRQMAFRGWVFSIHLEAFDPSEKAPVAAIVRP